VRFSRRAVAGSVLLACAIACGTCFAADVTFNITGPTITATPATDPRISDPLTPGTNGFTYADVWTEGGYVYVGTDRDNKGVTVHSISNADTLSYLAEYAGDPLGTPSFEANQMEDVEVWGGYGYFGSDVSTSSGTGVDIVNLAVPFDPEFVTRINGADGGHNKVHTLSVSGNHLYTTDNATDVIKIFNVSNPESPQFVNSLDLNNGLASHEVVVRNNIMYVASKSSGSGVTDIYDVSTPAIPQHLWSFPSGPSSHTSMPNADGTILVVAEERSDGNVHLYDLSLMGEPNQPSVPPLLATINRNDLGTSLPGKPTAIDGHSPHHPHIYGNLLFVTWYEAGLQVFNISDPTNPVHVGAYDTYVGGPPGGTANFSGNWGVDLTLGLDTVLLSDRQRGLIVVNATGVLAKGDYNHDMTVDEDDYAEWHTGFGAPNGVEHNNAPLADGNYDDFVDAADYVLWRKFLGTSGPGGAGAGSSSADSTGVPEPTAVVLWAIGIGAIIAGGRVRAGKSGR
jgi:hypothetical protein